MGIEIVHIPVESIDPNPWNPNRQNDQEYQAEVESIETFGFIAPIIVRPNGDRFEVVDGEHRLRAAGQLSMQTVPCVVLQLDDLAARKLTVVMNETRGKADPALLGKLFAELRDEVVDMAALAHALPFSESMISDFIELASFDWSTIEPPSDESFDSHAPTSQTITCVVSLADARRWAALSGRYEGTLPAAAGAANGVVLSWILDQLQPDEIVDVVAEPDVDDTSVDWSVDEPTVEMEVVQ